MAVDNLYALESRIIERLREKVPQFKTVACGSAIGSEISTLIDPAAAFVVPRAFRFDGDAGKGRSVKIVQPWEIIICVPHVHDLATLEGTAYQAGIYIYPSIAALAGWKPTNDYAEFRLAPEQSDPEFGIAGRAEFPILFETHFVIRGLG